MEESNQKQLWNPLRDPWITLGAVGVIVLLAIAVVTTLWLVRKKKDHAILDPAPGFTLRDQKGRLTSLAQFHGKLVLLMFIDPKCHQLCPLTTQSMVEAVQRLGPRAASQVQLLGVDANPLKMKVTDVADYTRIHGLQGRWRFLTGPVAQLKRVWRSYHVYVAVVKNDVEHTAVVYFIDRNGNERAVYSTPMSYESIGDQADMLARVIAQLLPDHPSLAVSSSALPPQTPRQKSALDFTTLGSKHQQVALGSAHSHLVVFFASWLGQESGLTKDLEALDTYATLARLHRWPSPVAVDELTTEPSLVEALKVLDPLAGKLKVPIVEDKTGRLADDYGVDDLPWFVLTSSSGRILWRHEGWVSAAVLDKQVPTALPHN